MIEEAARTTKARSIIPPIFRKEDIMKHRRAQSIATTFLRWTGAASALLILGGAPGAFGETDQSALPDTVEINIQATCPDRVDLPADKKKVARFSHRQHAEVYLKGKSDYSWLPYSDSFTCSACHTDAVTTQDIEVRDQCARVGTTLDKWGGGKSYKKNIHKICRTCHVGLKKAGHKNGPTNCKGCHGGKKKKIAIEGC